MSHTKVTIDPNSTGRRRRSSLRALTETKMTPVILVCIYNQGSIPVTHDVVYDAFRPFGKINRILIFDKLKVWKAFVEFRDIAHAQEAKRCMNDHLLFNDGTRMNVYFSNLEVIQFQNNNSGGKDYTMLHDDPDPEPRSMQSIQDDFSCTSTPYMMQNQDFYGGGPPLITHSLSVGAKASLFASFRNNNNNSSNGSNASSFHDEMPLKPSLFRPSQGEFLSVPPPITHSLSCGAKEAIAAFAKKKHHHHQPEESLLTPPIFMPRQEFLSPPPITHSLSVGAKASVSTMSKTNSLIGTPQQRTHRSNYDEKDDEILDIINEHQKESSLKNIEKELHFTNDEETDKDIYAEFFNQAFQDKPSAFEKQQLANAKTPLNNNNNLSLKSQPFGEAFNPQQPNNHPQSGVFPPKMPFYNNSPQPFPQTHTKNRSLTASQGNFIQINNSPNRFPGSRSPQYNNSLNSIPPNNFAPMHQQPMNFQPPEFPPNLHPQNFAPTGPQNFGEPQAEMNFSPEILINPETVFGEQPPVHEGIVDLIERDISQNMAFLHSSNNLGSLDNSSQFQNMIVDNSKKTPTLYVKGFEDHNITPKMIYNVFSNVGNITSIIFVREKAVAVIEYENADFAAVAKEHLNNLMFLGSPLRIFFSKYSIVKPYQNLNGTEEIFIPAPNTFRFKKNKSITINPPSAALHISNLPKEACQEDVIQHHFSHFGRIETMRITSVENRNTCLLKLGSIEESLLALAYLHDTDFYGRNMHISFTRIKI